MTIESTIKAYLESKGMWPDQAEAVLFQMKVEDAQSISPAMAGHWQDEAEGYPNVMLAVLLVTANRLALAWIDANKPKAWFRPMFADVPVEITHKEAQIG